MEIIKFISEWLTTPILTLFGVGFGAWYGGRSAIKTVIKQAEVNYNLRKKVKQQERLEILYRSVHKVSHHLQERIYAPTLQLNTQKENRYLVEISMLASFYVPEIGIVTTQFTVAVFEYQLYVNGVKQKRIKENRSSALMNDEETKSYGEHYRKLLKHITIIEEKCVEIMHKLNDE